MVEEAFEPPRRHNFETNPELARLRRAIERIVLPGSGTKELERLLLEEPQRDEAGQLRYLVTSGMAVEMVTRYMRKHHDLDLVIMDPRNINYWEIYGTDNVTPQWYWADMSFNPEFLDKTAYETHTLEKGYSVEVVHPGIIMVQKSSDAFGRPPREKDKNDVKAIVRFLREQEKQPQNWQPIVTKAVHALPRKQINTTMARLKETLGR